MTCLSALTEVELVMKPGIKTTEFWVALALTLVGPLVAVMVGFGVFKEEQAVEVQSSMSLVIESVSVIASNIVSLVAARSYINARTGLKMLKEEQDAL